MTHPRFTFVPVMDHEVHVTEWGTKGAPALVMMHGLARTGRDFDEIAQALSDEYHVLCPDMIGRGRSSWASDPDGEYTVEYYAGVASDLLDHFRIDTTAWLGTSMGGQIGMRLASGHQGDRLTCLLINDIGPEIPQPAIERILSYVGNPPHFESFAQGEIWLRSAYAPFGPATEEFWHRMARTSLRRRSDGRLTLHYDPAIVRQLASSTEELTTWDHWGRVTTPSHIFRGVESDLLTTDILEQMCASGPKPEFDLVKGCGHAPTLSRAEDIGRVREVLKNLTR